MRLFACQALLISMFIIFRALCAFRRLVSTNLLACFSMPCNTVPNAEHTPEFPVATSNERVTSLNCWTKERDNEMAMQAQPQVPVLLSV
mmetsp:Transcript_92762/g.288633  ORF Transcript_92762/g.288633 Transcript_92762/m.288633 type:complete len:89 (+) Transcript_92762:452-718(+)